MTRVRAELGGGRILSVFIMRNAYMSGLNGDRRNYLLLLLTRNRTEHRHEGVEQLAGLSQAFRGARSRNLRLSGLLQVAFPSRRLPSVVKAPKTREPHSQGRRVRIIRCASDMQHQHQKPKTDLS